MSEYQYVAFRAIDAPVSEKNLEYMERQSSRAEITPWSFDNEYHYGDFHGDALEMLRRGYDLHVHYANFGIRTVMIRLPHGWPDARAAKPYLSKEGLQWKKDRSGQGGSLIIAPFFESGELEELWDVSDYVEGLGPLQRELLAGDLRPLYLAHLAVACDGNHDPEETVEGPVPAGLDKLTAAQHALVEFYGLDQSLLAAAAQGCPKLPALEDAAAAQRRWLAEQSEQQKDQWLAQWVSDDHAQARGKILAAFRAIGGSACWPTAQLGRTINELRKSAEKLHARHLQQSAVKAEKARAKRLAAMAADPTPTLKATEKLVASRSTDAYRQTAAMLADLREALSGSKHAQLADEQARKLVKSHPTLNRLTAEMRRAGFLPK